MMENNAKKCMLELESKCQRMEKWGDIRQSLKKYLAKCLPLPSLLWCRCLRSCRPACCSPPGSALTARTACDLQGIIEQGAH